MRGITSRLCKGNLNETQGALNPYSWNASPPKCVGTPKTGGVPLASWGADTLHAISQGVGSSHMPIVVDHNW
jgi:hypothetical protein